MSNWNFGGPPLFIPQQPVKRRVFVSYCHLNQQEAVNFISRWQNVFTPRILGMPYSNDIINSTNPEYVMSQIRQNYLGDSTVTIVLIGSCTHSRRYVDWEIKASLRQGDGLPNGVVAFLLPSAQLQNGNVFIKTQQQYPPLPPRLGENYTLNNATKYARYWLMPTTDEEMRTCIEDAFTSRTTRATAIVNSNEMMKYNAQCRVCGATH
jgi:hypothetical protein